MFKFGIYRGAAPKGKQINKTGCKKHRETRNGQATNQKTKELGQRNKPDAAELYLYKQGQT